MPTTRHSRPATSVLALLVALLTIALTISVGPSTARAHDGHEHSKVLIFTKTTQFRHTEAITQGVPALQSALTTAGIESVHSEDSALFTDEGLAPFQAIMMFQTSGDPWTADQKAALQRYVQGGGGIVAVHNATDMRGAWAWWDTLVGTLMPGHATTGTSPGQTGTVRVEDRVHPSTDHLPQRWNRADEWYNFSTNVRGAAHVLATTDETTYDPGTNKMGYDHPISWCKPYDGGRVWATGMGHFGAHYTAEPQFVEHIVGGVEYASGIEAGECGATTWTNYEKVALDENTSAPFAMDIAPDGRVFYTELVRGQIRVYDPTTRETTTAATIPVYSGGEDGLLGIALAPDFATSRHLYAYYAPASTDDANPTNFKNRLSRFTVYGNTVDLTTEKVLLEVPARRLPDEPGHTGGAIDFDGAGNLFLSVGDDVNPHSEPSGGYAPLSTRTGTFHDARATSANTNDLRGKLLRIHPEPDGTYTIPEGNLFAPGTAKTRPEIYAMGFRNPFRFSVDRVTGWVSLADYSPDNGNDAPDTRGPAGIAEWNLIKSPGNYGWPLCMGSNEPFRNVDYGTTSAGPVVVGEFFDCARPVNDSPRNTGLTELPAARAADMFYGYKRSSVPSILPAGGGLAPMGGPVYRYDAALDSDTKFPEYFDGKAFFYEWARNKMVSLDIKDPAAAAGTQLEKANPFLPQEQFRAPIDSKFGPDGSLYVLDWGGGFGRDNPNSGLHRIDYVSGSRSPIAVARADRDTGPAPLTVAFDGTTSTDPENEALTYEWDFTGDGAVDATGATASHTYTENGVYNARLTVKDPQGKDGTTTVPITVGNTRPSVDFLLPPNGSFFDFGDDLSWNATVTDPEDGTVDGGDVVIQPALGHDGHAHPTTPLSGFTGTTPTSLGGHGEDENIFFAIDARYTDKGDASGLNPLTGSETSLLFPKTRQAEFFTAKSSALRVAPTRDPEGSASMIAGEEGAWAKYTPVNLRGIDRLVVRASANAAGTVELRRGAPDGPLLGTAAVPATGALSFVDVSVPVTDPGATFDLYLVLPGAGERRVNFVEAVGRGMSPTTRPEVAVTTPAAGAKVDPGATVDVAATATDAEHAVTEVEFFVDGTSVGTDTSAPYETTWQAPTTEKVYDLTAVATNDVGRTTTSRIRQVQVGELFGGLLPFSNAAGEFTKVSDGVFRITGAGADTWLGTDQYSALYAPAGVTDETWEAVVRVNSQTNTNGAAKAGIIVRNDMALPGSSKGYAIVGVRPSGGVEFLRDVDGNGQVEASSQAGTTAYPMWVKLRRIGTSYTAWMSTNGTAWTQVGPAVTLAGATTTQDVGMMMVSHASTAGTVEFQGFKVEDNPVVEQPLKPLTCPGPLSDEFAGTTLDPKWTTRTAPGSTLAVTGGVLRLPIAKGDINEASAGPISMASQPTPTGAWEASTRITLAHTSHWQWAGLVVHKSDDEYNKLAFVRSSDGSRFLEFQTETGGARTTHGAFTLPVTTGTTMHLRLVSDGAVLTAYWSTDGTAWTKLNGTAPLKTGGILGIVGAGDLGTTSVTADVDWFRVTPDRVRATPGPDDEFDGTALDGCRWDRTVRYDSNHATVAGGELRVTTQPGDINGSNPVKPSNFVLQDAPTGDWTATTRFKATQVHRWQYAGLLAYADDDNYVKADLVAANAPGTALDLRAELVSEVNGTFGSGGNRQLNVAETTESGWWYFKVTKTGTTYSAWVSDGGISWTPIGSPVTNATAITAIGLVAVGPEQTQPVVIPFDFFHIEEADTAAPTTSISWAPTTPDGENGWYTTPPSFTLTAADGIGSGVATSEYRIDGQAWTRYAAGPVALVGDGTHVVEYRSTDVAGNVEQVKESATVKVDTTAPETSADTATTPGNEVSVTLTATDATSGVAGTEVRVDGGTWAAYSSAVVVSGGGDHTVDYRSTDTAGNVEAQRSVSVSIDGTAPTLVVSGVSDGQPYGDSLVLALDWTATDASGIGSLTATLDGAAVSPGDLTLRRLSLGAHTVVVTAKDTAGNVATQSISFSVTTSYADVRTLVDTFAGLNYMTAKTRSDLQKLLASAEDAAAAGKTSSATKSLQKFQALVGSVTDSAARAVLRRDADVLLDEL